VKVLAFAYACEPGKGSEPGAGWGLARTIARELGECWVITRTNNRHAIEQALPHLPEADRLRFVYVDLPPWARWWKRGQRGVRLYYLLWQLAAVRRARKLVREERFDLVWHLTLANAWFGSLAPLVGGRFVYGPVGGGVGVPWRLARFLGVRGALYELARDIARLAGRYVNPLARLAWERAEVILAQNPETVQWLPRRHRSKARVFPNALAAVEELPAAPARRRPGGRTALFVGRLIPWKGGAIAIEAIAQAPDWRLVVLGEGPDRQRLERLAQRLGVAERVEFRGWQPRAEVWRVMREEADVLLFPSLHDESPLTVAEALALGLPVLCLDHGGPPVVARAVGAACMAPACSSDGVVAELAHGLGGWHRWLLALPRGARPSLSLFELVPVGLQGAGQLR
jgi:glycosyltransferase involved in cell wall biosynthesis